MKPDTVAIKYGIQECSKCQYFLRCEDCIHNEQATGEPIKSTHHEAVTDFAEKLKTKIAKIHGSCTFTTFAISGLINELLNEFQTGATNHDNP